MYVDGWMKVEDDIINLRMIYTDTHGKRGYIKQVLLDAKQQSQVLSGPGESSNSGSNIFP